VLEVTWIERMPAASQSTDVTVTELQRLKGLARPLHRRGAGLLRKRPRDGSAAEVAQIVKLVATINDVNSQLGQSLAAVTELRRCLTIGVPTPVQALVDAGGIAPLVACLQNSLSPVAKLDAAWALANVATGTSAQTALLVEAGAIQASLAVLASPLTADKAELCEQCLRILGNIACDEETAFHDHLFEVDVVGHLGHLYERLPACNWNLRLRVEVLRALTWLLSSLCRGHPCPPPECIDPAFDFFVQVVLGTDDAQMLDEALLGLLFLIQGAEGDRERTACASRILSAGFGPDEVPSLHAGKEHPLIGKLLQVTEQRSNSQSRALRVLNVLIRTPPERSKNGAIPACIQAFQSDLFDSRVKLQPDGAPVRAQRMSSWSSNSSDRENVPPEAGSLLKHNK